MGALPERTVEYNGFITQAHRWTDFRHRADDIFVCTPAKNGTTWTQAICGMLVFGGPDPDLKPGKISPWYDFNFAPAEEVNDLIEAQQHRRFLKTHTPLDGLPFFPECTYLAVYRDPRDAFFSMANHLENMNRGITENVPPQDPVEGFYNWCNMPALEGRAEYPALAAALHHLNTFWPWRHLPNVHLFHYADMKRDRPAAVRAIAKALGIAASEATVAAIAEATSFESMRENAMKFVPDADRGVWKEPKNFFRQARQGQWRDIIGERERKAYQDTVAATLPKDAADWLEHGGVLPV